MTTKKSKTQTIVKVDNIRDWRKEYQMLVIIKEEINDDTQI